VRIQRQRERKEKGKLEFPLSRWDIQTPVTNPFVYLFLAMISLLSFSGMYRYEEKTPYLPCNGLAYIVLWKLYF
jgi:hypothetical protein